MKLNKIKALGLAAAFGMAVPLTAFAGDKTGDKEGVDAHFKMLDSDGDGKISPEEHDAAAKKMFETMDANKDSKVTAEEMTAAYDKMPGKKGKAGGMSAADKIKTIDKDGDGVLTAEEHAAGAKSMFGMMDGDKDGFVTKAELAAGHHKMMMKKDATK